MSPWYKKRTPQRAFILVVALLVVFAAAQTVDAKPGADMAPDSGRGLTQVTTGTQVAITSSANPAAGGSTTGAGAYNSGDTVHMVATANPDTTS